MTTTHCLCTQLRRTARGVTKRYDDALADVGLTTAQFSLLRHLERLESPSITDLAAAMGLERSTLGRNVRVLEGQGLLELGNAVDQRNRLVSMTALGRARLDDAVHAWNDVQLQLTQKFGSEKRAALIALLDELHALE
ncbi:MarR family winged helix-turn-helix transcriptional regulator [Pseudomonas sp. PS02288]|uniref:MarR family winged helix-turn-helix transcriptional regulator n=1 Tax=Pseudomonas sp. PS02288 TaxID=2991443 RepID=UPI00249B6670|nr:MarR family winged helix-turn-helix transcriptional regulator [Pseudomonas sp. PS02288]